MPAVEQMDRRLLILMLFLDAHLRPRRPGNSSAWQFPLQYTVYFVMAVVTFFTSALLALDGQFRLATSKRLEYVVTEKALRPPAATARNRNPPRPAERWRGDRRERTCWAPQTRPLVG